MLLSYDPDIINMFKGYIKCYIQLPLYGTFLLTSTDSQNKIIKSFLAIFFKLCYSVR